MQQVKNFTQLPNVFIDLCDISDEALTLFMKLIRHYGHKGGVYSGSVRKLADILHICKSKLDRDLKKLHDAKIITLDNSRLTLTLQLDKLWKLNDLYNSSIEIPRWKNLDTVLETVSKMGQVNTSNVPEMGQNVPEMGQQNSDNVPEMGQNVPEMGQGKKSKAAPKAVAPGLFDSPNTSNTLHTNTSKTVGKQTAAIPSKEIPLSENASRVWLFFSNLEQHKVKKPTLKQLQADQCEELAQYVKSQEDMNSLYIHTRKRLQEMKMNNGFVYLGNMLKPEILNTWKKPGEVQEEPEQSSMYKKPEPEADKTKIVIWTKTPHYKGYCVENWWRYEYMTLEEAEKYDYLPGFFPPVVLRQMKQKLEDFKNGKIKKPDNSLAVA